MFNYTKTYLLLTIIIATNLFMPFLPKALIFISGLAFLILAALSYGAKTKSGESFGAQLAFGILFILTAAIFIGSAFFYFGALGNFAVLAILAVIFLKTKNSSIDVSRFAFRVSKIIASFPYLLLWPILIFLLINSRGAQLIQSPWLLLPQYFLPLFFAATLMLLYKNTGAKTFLHFFLFFGLAAFVYKLGYGFDQFIHEASQKYILEHGTITPKTLQYIGFYGTNIFLNKITGISIAALQKFLLPVLAALLLPLIIFYSLKKKELISSPLPIFGLLLLPLSEFIVSSPQGLANLLLLIFIFLSVSGYKKIWLPLAILLIHPISGIMAFIYFFILRLKSKKLALVGILALPLAFLFLSYRLSGQLNLHFNIAGATNHYFSLLTFGNFKKNYNLWLDLFYSFQYFILPVIILVSIRTARKYKNVLPQYPLCAFAISTFSFFITSAFVDFSYLINYEQQNYSNRIFYISFLFLAPYLIFTVEKIFKKCVIPAKSALDRDQGAKIPQFGQKIFPAALFAFFITANFYLTYPRFDNYQNDKGKNLTSWMIGAVQTVKKDAAGANYVVLTDQMISAAALKEDGFKKYFNTPLGQIFYYPVPTGGPLYNEFLNLVYKAAGSKSADNAKILTGAKIAYAILPSYWEDYERIKENLKSGMRLVFEDENLVILKLE